MPTGMIGKLFSAIFGSPRGNRQTPQPRSNSLGYSAAPGPDAVPGQWVDSAQWTGSDSTGFSDVGSDYGDSGDGGD